MNPLQKYAEIPPFAEYGYKPKTTFWGDFGVADVFVLNGMEPGAVQDTYNRSFEQYKNDKEYGTELAMVLNHKAWEHNDKGNMQLAKLYAKLYHDLDAYIFNTWPSDGLEYYLKITD
jgi:hypothetical protein